MPKRVSMKGHGLEAVYGAYKATPVRRSASIEAYPQPGPPEQQHDDPALLKATFYLDRDTIEILESLWLDERRRGRRGRSKSALVRLAIRLLAEREQS
jgi:hypothetical protein